MTAPGSPTRSARPSASRWAEQLGRSFARVAVFALDGTQAEVVAVHGISHRALGVTQSLLDRTPLRWAIEAASPIVCAGRSPGGAAITTALGLEPPRSYAVIPLALPGAIVGLAYADAREEPLSLGKAIAAFSFCRTVLEGPAVATTPRRRARRRAVARRPRARAERWTSSTFADVAADEISCESGAFPAPDVAEEHPHAENPAAAADVTAFAALVQASMAALGAQSADTPPPSEHAAHDGGEAASESAVLVSSLRELGRVSSGPAATRGIDEDPGEPSPRPATSSASPTAGSGWPATPTFYAERVAVVTPSGVVPFALVTRRGRARRITSAAAAGAAAIFALGVSLLGPAADASAPTQRVVIAPQAPLAGIAQSLQSQGIIRSAVGFEWLARLSGAARSLRAGTYQLSPNAWAWEHLHALAGGQIETVQVTIPEGLTLREIANLLETHRLAAARDVVAAASEPALLRRYGVVGATVEGYLFPETYVFARGVGAREIVAAMLDVFFTRVRSLPAAAMLDEGALHERVIVASIVEREARDKTELTRIAGVFQNRLDRRMKLESCATVQYLLGRRKERLSLADVRRPSPYNTYLHPGLPPGPIGSPGLAALQAALAPERHEYLFFFAREDGSHRHVFTRTYAEHLSAQRLLARRE